MDDVTALTGAFARTAAALTVLLADQLKAKDPETHAQLEVALAAGHHVALSLVTSAAGGPKITLDLVTPGAELRVTVLTVPAKGHRGN
jgi:hypothetical protein